MGRIATVLDAPTPAPKGAAVAATSTNRNKELPPTDRAFVGASLQYLKVANQSGTTMAEILAGATAGTSTLTDCRAALLQALSDETANYSHYRADRGQVPSAFLKVDRQITENHVTTISALKTTLSYWQTGDLSAISRGMDAYKAAVAKGEGKCDTYGYEQSHGTRRQISEPSKHWSKNLLRRTAVDDFPASFWEKLHFQWTNFWEQDKQLVFEWRFELVAQAAYRFDPAINGWYVGILDSQFPFVSYAKSMPGTLQFSAMTGKKCRIPFQQTPRGPCPQVKENKPTQTVHS